MPAEPETVADRLLSLVAAATADDLTPRGRAAVRGDGPND